MTITPLLSMDPALGVLATQVIVKIATAGSTRSKLDLDEATLKDAVGEENVTIARTPKAFQ